MKDLLYEYSFSSLSVPSVFINVFLLFDKKMQTFQ